MGGFLRDFRALTRHSPREDGGAPDVTLVREGSAMINDEDRWRRLREAGVITKELPSEYAAVIDGMTEEEERVILDLKGRLDEAGRLSDLKPGQSGLVF
jgi:hypothetical protein